MIRLALTVSLLVSSAASAMCALSQPFFLPAAGTAVPANPTLFLFAPGYTLQDRLELRALNAVTKAELPLVLTKLATVDGFRAWKVKITAPADTRFLLKGVPGVESVGEWTTGPFEKSGELVLKRGTDITYAWACSFTGLRVLDSSLDAPAYRVEFAESEEKLRAGQFRSVVVDGHNGAFGERETQPRQVQLGHRSCTGFNFRWDAAPRLAVRVTALLADGTERASKDVFVLDAPPSGLSE
jgi:hypothetical protein